MQIVKIIRRIMNLLRRFKKGFSLFSINSRKATFMDLGIKGKKALVMGGSTGLGFAIAKALSEEGAIVVLCSRNEQRLKRAASEVGAALAIPADLGQAHAGRGFDSYRLLLIDYHRLERDHFS